VSITSRGFYYSSLKEQGGEDMGCLFAVIAVLSPRLALALVWIFTNEVTKAFHGAIIWPLLGLIFLPFTTLIYCLVYATGTGVTGWGWLFVVIAFLVDMAAYGGSGYTNRDRIPKTA
jgi:hypothetical protein